MPLRLRDLLNIFRKKDINQLVTSEGPESAIPYRIGHEVYTTEEAVHPSASLYQKLLSPAYNRIFRYSEYEYMRLTSPIVNLANELYAMEATLGGVDAENAFVIQIENEPYKEKIISKLIQDWFKNTYELTGLTLKDIFARLIQYGDLFLAPLFLKGDEKKRVIGFKILPEEQIFRIFCIDTQREIFLQDIQIFKPAPSTTFASIQQPLVGGETFEAWSHIEKTEKALRELAKSKANRIHIFDEPVFHFRINLGLFYPYGTSIFEPARLAWRQVRLMEDSLVVYRIVRGPERLLFKVKLGRLPRSEADQYMMEVRRALRKQPLASAVGQRDITQAPLVLGMLDDLFIPVWEDRDIEVTQLTQAAQVGSIQDVLLFVDNLAIALRIPKEILLGTEVPTETTKALVARDVRFAIAVRSIQDSFVRELRRAIKYHLQNIGNPIEDFKIKMISPGTYEEAVRISILKERIELLERLNDLKTNLGLPIDLAEAARIYLQLPPELWQVGSEVESKLEEIKDSLKIKSKVKGISLTEKDEEHLAKLVFVDKELKDLRGQVLSEGLDFMEYSKIYEKILDDPTRSVSEIIEGKDKKEQIADKLIDLCKKFLNHKQ